MHPEAKNNAFLYFLSIWQTSNSVYLTKIFGKSNLNLTPLKKTAARDTTSVGGKIDPSIRI
jgi:hypothetical protein